MSFQNWFLYHKFLEKLRDKQYYVEKYKDSKIKVRGDPSYYVIDNIWIINEMLLCKIIIDNQADIIESLELNDTKRQKKHEGLNQKCDTLVLDFDKLKEDNIALKQERDELKESYITYKSKYEELKKWQVYNKTHEDFFSQRYFQYYEEISRMKDEQNKLIISNKILEKFIMKMLYIMVGLICFSSYLYTK